MTGKIFNVKESSDSIKDLDTPLKPGEEFVITSFHKNKQPRINIDRRWSKLVATMATWCKEAKLPTKRLNSQSLFCTTKITVNGIEVHYVINARSIFDKVKKVTGYYVGFEAFRIDKNDNGKTHSHVLHNAVYQFSNQEIIDYTSETRSFKQTFMNNTLEVLQKVENLNEKI